MLVISREVLVTYVNPLDRIEAILREITNLCAYMITNPRYDHPGTWVIIAGFEKEINEILLKEMK